MSSPPISLVVTDLDGTFWHHADDVPPAAVAAAQQLLAKEVPLLVATGRRLTSTRVPLAQVGLSPPAVVLNGALGVELASGDRFHRSPWPPGEAAKVFDAFASIGLAPVVYVDHPDWDVYLAANPSTHPKHVRSFGATAGVGDLAQVVEREAVLGFGMIGVPFRDAEGAREAVGELAEVHLDRSLDYPGLATLTVAPLGQSKWDGILAFCAASGLDPGGVLALADGSNDLELLDAAAVRLVPEVAHPAALERADHVIPAAADGGWASVLDFVGS